MNRGEGKSGEASILEREIARCADREGAQAREESSRRPLRESVVRKAVAGGEVKGVSARGREGIALAQGRQHHQPQSVLWFVCFST